MVLGNTIRTSGDDGIVATDWNIINNNFVYTTTDDGIYLQGVETVCTGNRVETADVGIRIKLNEANNSVQSNSIFSAVTDSIVDLGIDSLINNNQGYDYDSLQDGKIWNSNGNYWPVDFSSDDVQIQAAIDDCGASGTVWLPAGTLDIDVYINHDDNIHLKGAGKGVTILKAGANLAGTGIIGCSSDHNWTISDLSVDGNRTGAGDGNCIQALNCNDITIDRVSVYSSGGNNMMIENCERAHITNCLSYDTSGAYHCYALKNSHHCTLSDLTAKDTDASGAYGLDMSYSDYNTVTNINIIDCYYGMKITGTGASVLSENNVVSNVIIEGCSTGADEHCFYTSYCKNLSLTNFVIDGGHIGVNLFGTSNIQLTNFDVKNVDHAIQIYSDDVTITNFNSESDTGSGYSVHCLTQENVHLVNCHFNEPYGTPWFDQVDNLTIIGCTFMDGEDGGLRIEDCNYVTVTGCISSGNNDDGLDITGVCTNMSITGNNFINNGVDGTGYGIDISATAHDNYIILGNVLIGNTDDNDDDGTGAKSVANNLGTWV